jgi:murein lipoprotein
MATFTENDLKELKDFIVGQFKEVNGKIDRLSEQLNSKIDKLSEEVNNLRVDIANIKGELTGVNKRLDNLEFTNRTIFVAIVTALMAGLVKLFLPNLPTNP